MLIEPIEISGLLKVTPRKFTDSRGYFMETFRSNDFSKAVGKHVSFLQENHSTSLKVGTVRGLHYQSPPHAQGKLVRCTRGAILDVAVDARIGSKTYGQHVKIKLSDENSTQLWLPAGFLHGFVTLVDNTDVNYKCTDYYVPECDGSVLWNDADLAIDWGVTPQEAHLSDKDKFAQTFQSFDSPFFM